MLEMTILSLPTSLGIWAVSPVGRGGLKMGPNGGLKVMEVMEEPNFYHPSYSVLVIIPRKTTGFCCVNFEKNSNGAAPWSKNIQQLHGYESENPQPGSQIWSRFFSMTISLWINVFFLTPGSLVEPSARHPGFLSLSKWQWPSWPQALAPQLYNFPWTVTAAWQRLEKHVHLLWMI